MLPQVYNLRSRVTLNFDLLTAKVDRFVPLPRGLVVPICVKVGLIGSKIITFTSLVKPNAQRKTELNSTQLNWIVQLSSVQFSPVHWTGDELRRPATSPSPVVAARRRVSSSDWLADSRECAPIVKKLRRSPISSPNRRGSSPVQCTGENWTELNSTVQLSWVQFSFQLCIDERTDARTDRLSFRLPVGLGGDIKVHWLCDAIITRQYSQREARSV